MEPNTQLLLALLLVEHEDGNLDEEELLLFVHGIMPDLPGNLIQSIGNHLVFERIDRQTCIRRFRFTKPQVLELVHRLGLPDVMRSPSQHSWTGLEGLLVVLRRLSYPGRLGELCEEFGRSKSALSIVFNFTLLWIYNRWDGLLTNPFTRPFFLRQHAWPLTAKQFGISTRWVWMYGDSLMARSEASAGPLLTSACSTMNTREYML